MTAKGRGAAASVQWLAGSERRESCAAQGESTLIFGIDAALALEFDSQTLVLEPWDLGVISNGSAQVARLESRAAANPSAVFFATINDNVRGP
jgi:hypothetical protein